MQPCMISRLVAPRDRQPRLCCFYIIILYVHVLRSLMKRITGGTRSIVQLSAVYCWKFFFSALHECARVATADYIYACELRVHSYNHSYGFPETWLKPSTDPQCDCMGVQPVIYCHDRQVASYSYVYSYRQPCSELTGCMHVSTVIMQCQSSSVS